MVLGIQTVHVLTRIWSAAQLVQYYDARFSTNPRPLQSNITTYALCDSITQAITKSIWFNHQNSRNRQRTKQCSGSVLWQGQATGQTGPIAPAYQNAVHHKTIWFTISNTTTGCFSCRFFDAMSTYCVFPTPWSFQCSNGASNKPCLIYR
jgi:hypothetical protein